MDTDPITRLARDIAEEGHPDLDWVIEYGSRVEDAWEASADPSALWTVACLAHPRALMEWTGHTFLRAMMKRLDEFPRGVGGEIGVMAEEARESTETAMVDALAEARSLGASGKVAVRKALDVFVAEQRKRLGSFYSHSAARAKALEGARLATLLREHIGSPSLERIMAAR